MALKGTPSVLRLSKTDVLLMCSGALLWAGVTVARVVEETRPESFLMLLAAVSVLASATLAQAECRVALRSVLQKTTAALVLTAVGYSWLVQHHLVWEGMALPIVLTLLVPWHLVLSGIAVLSLLLLMTLGMTPSATAVWLYLGGYTVACWLALFLAWRQRQLDDAHIEARSGDAGSRLYNLRRMEIELAREISRADRGNTGLVVLCFRLPEFDPVDPGAIDLLGLSNALGAVMPRHYSAFRVNHKTLAVIMPVATVDDVVLLSADLSDALGEATHELSGLPLVYVPRSVQPDGIKASEQRIEDMMTVVRKLAE